MASYCLKSSPINKITTQINYSDGKIDILWFFGIKSVQIKRFPSNRTKNDVKYDVIWRHNVLKHRQIIKIT